MSNLVLDLAADPGVAERLSGRLPRPAERLQLAEIQRLGPWPLWRRLRSRRFERCVVIVNDLRAQRRWLSVLALSLAVRAGVRELWDPAGERRKLNWSSALRRELPHVISRTLAAWNARPAGTTFATAAAVPGGGGRADPAAACRLRAGRSGPGARCRRVGGAHPGGDRRLRAPRLQGRPSSLPVACAASIRAGRTSTSFPRTRSARSCRNCPTSATTSTQPRRSAGSSATRGADLLYHRHALGVYAAAGVAQSLGIPLVVEFNGSEVWIARHWGHGLPHESLFAEIERRGLQAADLVVAVSEPLREQLHEAGVPDERILINPNGVDADRFDPERWSAHRGGVRDELEVGDEDVLVGFVGTFGPWHGAEILAQAAARIAPPWSTRLRYLYIGDGDRRTLTERRVREAGMSDRVHFAGLVPQEETPRLLAACDICASPHVPNPDGTPFFGSPTKLFEYLASGRPVLASELGQIGELLRHDENAWLVPPGDVERLAAGLERLASDPPLRARLGATGRRAATTVHSWQAHVQRILDRLNRPGGSS